MSKPWRWRDVKVNQSNESVDQARFCSNHQSVVIWGWRRVWPNRHL